MVSGRLGPVVLVRSSWSDCFGPGQPWQRATFRIGRSAKALALTWGMPIAIPDQRCEMKSPTSLGELQKRLGAPSNETIESLRLLKAFLRLAPGQRFEII